MNALKLSAARYTGAVAITAAYASLAHFLLGRPALTGIDDANITQVYAAHIAAGHGYVYNFPGERVEGATSMLWVVLNTLAFFSSRPEFAILVICALSTAFAVANAGRLYSVLARESQESWFVREPAFVLAAFALMPSFFAWGVVTLMEVGLWCALVLVYANALVDYSLELARAGRVGRPRWVRDALLLSAMTLCRPESLGVVVLSLVVFCAVNAFRAGRETMRSALKTALGQALMLAAVQGAIATFRVVYFGFPFPNTYYAKVSSNAFDNLASGARYLAIFVGDQYLAPLFALGLAYACVEVARAFSRSAKSGTQGDPISPFARALAMVTGVALVALALPVAMGGDHFGSQRFFQPAFPLLAIMVAVLLNRVVAHFNGAGIRVMQALHVVLVAVLAAGASVAFFDRNRLVKEFDISVDGRQLGEALTTLFGAEGGPSVGVITAGGIHRTYHGPVFDLLALNWVEMAHSTGRRRGHRNHSAFSPDVFWAHPPDVVTPSFVPDRNTAATVRPSLYLAQIESQPRFRDAYRVVVWDVMGRHLTAFVSARLAPRLTTHGAEVIPWDRVTASPDVVAR